MFKKVLIANRGEIALRVIRACREMGLKSVAVHSTADTDALHVKFADEAVCIGPPPSRGSYLNVPMIISAAEVTGADAVHPGYGFLSENAEFAEVCKKCGLTWIGPPPEAMRLMGDKISARAAMAKAGVPMLPGSSGIHDEITLLETAERIGFPVILKASAGGGGRGMKIVHEKEKLLDAWSMGRTEAQAAFGNPEMFMERYCQRPRHIEIQVVGDKHGHYTHLGERECSIQRRHQKVIEEAPSAALSDVTRKKMQEASVKAIEAIGYYNVGTMEYLLDTDGSFYFMEMNTRLQVEHPVTELVHGVDLVREQIRIAAGEPLSESVMAADRKPRGHAIELRVNAEDPNTFAPWPGKITALHMPGGLGVRVDTHVYAGYVVPPNYDSLLAKVIVHDVDRPAAIRRARRCLEEMVIEGPRTNIPFLRRIVNHPDFIRGDFDTGFVARMLTESIGRLTVTLDKAKVIDTARKLADKGKLDKAVKEYRRIVQEDPKDVRVWLAIGDLCAKKGAKKDATDAYLAVARVYEEQGFFLKAVSVYKQVLELEPTLVDVLLKLAELYQKLGLMTDAQAALDAAKKLGR